MVSGGKRTNKGVDEEMKTAIVYYSLEGNTKYVADKITAILKESCEVDVLRLEPEKSYPDKGFKKFFWATPYPCESKYRIVVGLTIELRLFF